jgi:hypothetical protein
VELRNQGLRRRPHQNRFEEAAWVEKEFQAAWSKSDVELKLDDLL